jgi:hypothetical protein
VKETYGMMQVPGHSSLSSTFSVVVETVVVVVAAVVAGAKGPA